MSWKKMNQGELKLIRALLGVTSKEAAECIGGCGIRAWQHYESGRNKVPENVSEKLKVLIKDRNSIVKKAVSKCCDNAHIKSYENFEDFLIDYPGAGVLNWRLYQSAMGCLFAQRDDIELSDSIACDKDSFIYHFFSKLEY